jgi:hypothetical protein
MDKSAHGNQPAQPGRGPPVHSPSDKQDHRLSANGRGRQRQRFCPDVVAEKASWWRNA